MRGISTAALEAASACAFPGNVRELENLVERAVILSRGPVLELDPTLLPAPSAGPTVSPALAAEAPDAGPAGGSPARSLTLEEVEREHFLSVLARTRWIIEGEEGAARLLNLSPSTARSRMKKLGIVRPS